MIRRPPRSTLFPLRDALPILLDLHAHEVVVEHSDGRRRRIPLTPHRSVGEVTRDVLAAVRKEVGPVAFDARPQETPCSVDRKSTRLNSSHANISYAVFCLSKK